MGGHLFIINGDLTKLACDAILIPTDRPLSITPHWEDYLRNSGHWDHICNLQRDPAAAWNGRNMIPLKRKGNSPQIWLGKIGTVGNASNFEAYAPKIRDFVRTSLRQHNEFGKKQRIYGWDKPRLALPIIGTDRGGGAKRKGDLILGMVDELAQLTGDAELDVDIVLVAFGEKPYTAAQRARRIALANANVDTIRAHWKFDNETQSVDLVERAKSLAEAAIASRLVLFLGAGVSAGAGLPNWTELLGRIAKKAKFGPHENFKDVDHRDQATILQRQLNLQNKSLGKSVAKELAKNHYSLAGGLLASLPSTEAVTTNFDTLFETAWATAGRKVSVLPDEAVESKGRWLLKLHGSIEKPEKIILTRADYLDMPRQHGALMGLVQGLLLMRHMMFVGYSMRDEDFHELVYEVRNAVGRQQNAQYIGTVLTLEDDPLTDELWASDLRVVPMTARCEEMSDEARSRQLEIFLDLVGFLSTTSASFFLDKTYDDVSRGEEKLRADLSKLFWTVYRAKDDDSVGRKVLRFLEDELGAGVRDTAKE